MYVALKSLLAYLSPFSSKIVTILSKVRILYFENGNKCFNISLQVVAVPEPSTGETRSSYSTRPLKWGEMMGGKGGRVYPQGGNLAMTASGRIWMRRVRSVRTNI